MIQESPLHNFMHLSTSLLSMAEKKSRREALLAIDAICDLFLNGAMPKRKLKYFRDQPIGNDGVTNKHLVIWVFEDAIKKLYFQFLQILEVSYFSFSFFLFFPGIFGDLVFIFMCRCTYYTLCI